MLFLTPLISPTLIDTAHTMKAKLTYHQSPACLADREMVYNTWYTVYDRAGRVVVETTDEDTASRAADQFDEIIEAETA